MDTTSMGGLGTLSIAADKTTLGGQVVTNTLNNLNNSSGMDTPGMTGRGSFENEVVNKTLDAMNYGGASVNDGVSQSYQLNQDVLGAVYSGKGAVANVTT